MFFPQHDSNGEEGFYAGLTFLPTDTQDLHCLVPVARAQGIAHAECFPLTPGRELFYELRN